MRRVMVVAAAGGRDTTCLEPLCMLFMGHHARSHTANPHDDGSTAAVWYNKTYSTFELKCQRRG